MSRGSKVELTLEEVDAIVLPHGGTRTAPTGLSRVLPRAPYYWNGPRGRACCIHVFSGERSDMQGHRCGKIASVTETVDGDDRDFCAFHASPAVAKRDAAQRAKWDAEAAQRAARRAAEQAKADALTNAERWKAALQQIAAGDNDPRRTARIALGLETANAEERY